MKTIAHKYITPKGKVYQSLWDHLINVAVNASTVAEPYGLKSTLFMVGLLHDVGKAHSDFYKKLTLDKNIHVNHSSAGGHYLINYCKNKPAASFPKILFFSDMCAYVIFAHHGLFDILADDITDKFSERDDYFAVEDKHYEEDVCRFIRELNTQLSEAGYKNLNELIEDSYIEIANSLDKINGLTRKAEGKIDWEEKQFYISCTIRFMLSLLKDADVDDAIAVESPDIINKLNNKEKQAFFKQAHDNVEAVYEVFKKNTQGLGALRTQIAEDAKIFAANTGVGIYNLDVPTGGGKTLTALRYAIENAKTYKKDRIIYVTSFLSVLEQSAATIKDTLKDDENILEHHSNVIKQGISSEAINTEDEDDNPDLLWRQYLEDTWEAPIILTTMVQFFNTLFKGRSNNLRRFNKLKNAVIIIDEVQSIPIKAIYLFNLMMNFMREFMGCNIVLCSATQPPLELNVLTYPLKYGDINYLKKNVIQLESSMKKRFDRVKYFNLTGSKAQDKMSTDDLADHVLEKFKEKNNVLIILNTKNAVRKLYNALKSRCQDKVVYLTTNMCGHHRLKVIEDMKTSLKKGEKLLCVSTQLIEAGVDIDFNVVYRSLAGIDSIIQAAGRCNREGNLPFGEVYMIAYEEERLDNLKEIKSTVDVCEIALCIYLGDNPSKAINMDTLQNIYYKRYFNNKVESMSYSLGKDAPTLLDLLGRNKTHKAAYLKNIGLEKTSRKIFQAFKTAATAFNLIENETEGIIVRYQNKDLIEKMEEAICKCDYKGLKSILKKLQAYTVNVYNLDDYCGSCTSYRLGTGETIIHVLDKDNYDEILGVLKDGVYDANDFIQ